MESNGLTVTQSIFSDEEVKEISDFKRCDGGDHIEVTCGCTSRKYGDAVGTLRVYLNGHLEINCDCTPGCEEEKLSPAAFMKHSGRETAGKWKNSIWVISNGYKVPLAKTVLLKHYYQALKQGNANRSQACHHDEFVCCKVCGKQRRFRLRNKEECRAYHDASRNDNWKCSDTTIVQITCNDEEERASRRVYKGCSRAQTCQGCTSCVCFGCEICRFSDCSCQPCLDYTSNVNKTS